jgi:thymidylate kinase
MSSLRGEGNRHRLALKRLDLPQFPKRDDSPPAVIALEGPNGAGKTTLCQGLASALGVPFALGTDPAWFTTNLKARMIRDADWHSSAMFFLSGCFEQMRLLRRRPQPMVIMDRSLWSTLAVHAAESTERLAAILDMLRPIAPLVHPPRLTLVLEASFSTCQTRIARKSGVDRALDELTATQGFHAREQEFYRWLRNQTPNVTFLNVDKGSPRQVLKSALALIRKELSC